MRFLLQFLSIRYWWRHKGAFLLASLGVALGIAVFVSIQIANASVLNAFTASIDAVSGTANLQIRGGSSGLPDELFARIEALDDARISAATPRVSRTLVSPTLKTSVLVNGIDFFSEIDFHDLDTNAPLSQSQNGAKGEPIRFLLDPGAIAISESLARKNGLKVGSKVDFNVGASRKSFRVASILDEAQSGRAFGGDYALLDIAAAQEALGLVGKLSQIDLRVDDKQVEAVARELRRMSPPDAVVSPPATRGAQIGSMLGAFRLNLTALSSIAAFVGAFLIYNALASAVVRRRSEAAILRSVGASGAQITGLFLIEAAFIGALGSSVGFALGVVLAKWTLGAVATTVSQLYIAVKARELFIPFWLFPFSVGAGTILSVVAAFPSAREASLASPRAGLSSANLHTTLEAFAPKIALGGLALLALALILSLPAVSHISPLLGFGAAGATMGGFCFLVPLSLLRASRWVRPIGEKLGGIEGALAADNTRRALNRSSLVVSALLVSIALIVGMNWMVRSFRATVGDWIDNTISADVFVATSDGFSGEHGPGLPPEVVEWATKRPDVRVFDTLRQANVEIAGQPTLLLANDLPSFRSGDRVIRWISTRGSAQDALRDYQSGRAVLLSERLSNLLKVGAGDVLRFPTPRGGQTFPVAGVFYDYNPNAVFYLSRREYQRLWGDDQLDGVALYLNKTSGEEFKRQLFAHFGSEYALTVFAQPRNPASGVRHFRPNLRRHVCASTDCSGRGGHRRVRHARLADVGAHNGTGELARDGRFSFANPSHRFVGIRVSGRIRVDSGQFGGTCVGGADDFRHQPPVLRLDDFPALRASCFASSARFGAGCGGCGGRASSAPSGTARPRFRSATRVITHTLEKSQVSRLWGTRFASAKSHFQLGFNFLCEFCL